MWPIREMQRELDLNLPAGVDQIRHDVKDLSLISRFFPIRVEASVERGSKLNQGCYT